MENNVLVFITNWMGNQEIIPATLPIKEELLFNLVNSDRYRIINPEIAEPISGSYILINRIKTNINFHKKYLNGK